MTSITHNPTTAGDLARFTIDERVRAADARVGARSARRRTRHTPEPQSFDLPVWAFRFLHPAH